MPGQQRSCGGLVELRDPLQRLAAWSNKKCGSTQLSALLGASELSIGAGDVAGADKLLRQCSLLLRSREVFLPRAEARWSTISALHAFAQKRAPQGASSLQNALQFMHGSVATGSVVPAIFQSQLTLDLLASQSLTDQDGEAILAEIVAEPTIRDWELSPLETIAELTTARDPVYARLLHLAVARKAAVEQIVEGMDRLQRQRLFSALPLGGRQFCWRLALAQPPDQLSATTRAAVAAAIVRTPELVTLAQGMTALVERLRKAPLPLDERKLPADDKKAMQELERFSSDYESTLAFESLQRRYMERSFPPMAQLETLRAQLQSGDLLLAFVVAGQQVIGVALTSTQTQAWQIADSGQLDAHLQELLSLIRAVRGEARDPRAKMELDHASSATAAWRKSAAQLSSVLFPAEVQQLLAACQRTIVAPHDRLWYVPFEMLPLEQVAGQPTWIAHHQITYVPTLGSVGMAFMSPPVIKNSVGVVDNFFALDVAGNQLQTLEVSRDIPNSHVVTLTQKVTVPSAAWLKLRTDQLWLGAVVDCAENHWNALVLPIGNGDQASLSSWLAAPLTSPKQLVLPGVSTSIASGTLAQGDDLFLPICAAMFSGSQHMSLSRWPVGGRSTAILLQRQLEELHSESPSAALRRSVLALWPEQLLTADEPVLRPLSQSAPTVIEGSHPLLWSGYMTVGDTVLNQP